MAKPPSYYSSTVNPRVRNPRNPLFPASSFGIYPGATIDPRYMIGEYPVPFLASNTYGLFGPKEGGSGMYIVPSTPPKPRTIAPTSSGQGSISFNPFEVPTFSVTPGSGLSPGGNILPTFANPAIPESNLALFEPSGKRSLGSQYAQFVQGVQSWGNPDARLQKTMAPYSGALQTQSVNRFLQKPSAETAVGAGATYALNANPYYAGVNMITGGALDKGVQRGISWFGNQLRGNRKPPPDPAKVSQQLALANATADARNRYLQMYQESRKNQQQADENIGLYRQQAENLAAFGLSPRQTVGQVASALPTAATEAALASTQASAAQRGITGGVPSGAEAALRAGMAQAAGQVGTALTQDVLNRADAMRGQLFQSDMSQRQQAAQNALASLGAATELPFQLQAANLAEQRQREARDQQIYERRQAEQGQIGQLIGLLGPSILERFGKKGVTPTDATATQPGNGFGALGGPGAFGINPNTNRGYYLDPSGAARDFDTNEIITDQWGRPVQGGDFNPAPDYTNPFTGETYFTGSDGKMYSTATGAPLYPSEGTAAAGGATSSGKVVETRTQIMLDMANQNAKVGDVASVVPEQLKKYGSFVKGPDGLWRKL